MLPARTKAPERGLHCTSITNDGVLGTLGIGTSRSQSRTGTRLGRKSARPRVHSVSVRHSLRRRRVCEGAEARAWEGGAGHVARCVLAAWCVGKRRTGCIDRGGIIKMQRCDGLRSGWRRGGVAWR
jgi:hypothetical protein